jgi:hypothetical protein
MFGQSMLGPVACVNSSLGCHGQQPVIFAWPLKRQFTATVSRESVQAGSNAGGKEACIYRFVHDAILCDWPLHF